MRFGPAPIEQAEGAMLAHAQRAGSRMLRKGRVLSADDIHALGEAGISEVIVARLDPDDVGEDNAAKRIAAAMRCRGVEVRGAATGRVNLHALQAGVVTVDATLVDALNAVDPGITLATLRRHETVAAGQMVATVKIIPFAVPERLVARAAELLAAREILAAHPFRAHRIGLAQTELPSLKSSVLDKTRAVTAERLARSGSAIVEEMRMPHRAEALAAALTALAARTDLVIAFGASALTDFDDVIPAAIRAAGGEVLRAGMPVDPGNLIVLGRLNGKPVVGAPGCARSPRENGFDWVLDRLIAGLDVASADIAAMGVGGLLMEIPTRPQPRENVTPPASFEVAAIVLAAGRSSRMGGPNKLLAAFEGAPLIRRIVERVMAADVAEVVVVTGYQAERIGQALETAPPKLVHNSAFGEGLSSSLKAGIAAVDAGAAGALVMLGDMPAIATADLDQLIAAFRAGGGALIVRATHDGRRGNPVILPRSLFSAVASLHGDMGARALVEAGDVPVIDVEIGAAASIDVDTPEALAAAGGVLQG